MGEGMLLSGGRGLLDSTPGPPASLQGGTEIALRAVSCPKG